MKHKLALRQIEKCHEGEIAAAGEHDNPFENGHASRPTLERVRIILTTSPESWPGLSRPSTSRLLRRRKKDVDARDKRGHDGGGVIRSHRNRSKTPRRLSAKPRRRIAGGIVACRPQRSPRSARSRAPHPPSR